MLDISGIIRFHPKTPTRVLSEFVNRYGKYLILEPRENVEKTRNGLKGTVTATIKPKRKARK